MIDDIPLELFFDKEENWWTVFVGSGPRRYVLYDSDTPESVAKEGSSNDEVEQYRLFVLNHWEEIQVFAKQELLKQKL